MKESTSSNTTVVGLFRARGSAENVRNRLKTEGLSSEDRMVLKVLKETAPLPPSTQMVLYTLSLDPLFDILGGPAALLRPRHPQWRDGSHGPRVDA